MVAGELGAMITLERAQRIERLGGRKPGIGDLLLFTSVGEGGFRIREVPLVGIYRYQNPGQFMNEIILMDPQTVRALNQIQVAGTAEASEEAVHLLSMDFDDLFSDSFSFFDTADDEFSTDFLHAFLTEEREEPEELLAGGDWNFIILRLEEGRSSMATLSSLNRSLSDYGIMAVNWRIAAGLSAILMLLVQSLFNAGVFLISVAGVIAIINILLIAVFRRIREIGTLRAIGATDRYIRTLIISENLILSLVAGFFGVLFGVLFINLVNRMDLSIPNDLIASLLGGAVLRLDLVPSIGIWSFLVAALLGLASSLYPVERAVRIEPMAAVRRG